MIHKLTCIVLATSFALASYGQTQLSAEHLSKKADSLRKSGDHKTAIIFYRQALDKDSSNKKLFCEMGICKMQVKNYIGAIDDLSTYIISDKDNSDPFTKYYSYVSMKSRGLCYLQINEKLNACRDFNKASEIISGDDIYDLIKTYCN